MFDQSARSCFVKTEVLSLFRTTFLDLLDLLEILFHSCKFVKNRMLARINIIQL